MEEQIYALVVEDGVDSEPFAGLAVAVADVWNVTFGFDKSDLLEMISSHKDTLPELNLQRYSEIISKSELPDYGYRDVINIDGYIGLRLAQAISKYEVALNSPFPPNSGWPMTSEIPDKNLTYMGSIVHREDLSFDDEIDLFNVLISLKNEAGCSVYIVNSREQCDDVIERMCNFSMQRINKYSRAFENLLLPETSVFPAVTLQGGIAEFVHAAVSYENYARSKFDFGNPPWRDNFRQN